MSDWFMDNLGWVFLAVAVVLIGGFVRLEILKERDRQAMVGRTRDQIIQQWGPPSMVTPIEGGEVDTWATFHEGSTSYVMTGGGQGGGGVALPITTPPSVERTVVTFVNNVAIRVEHP